MITQVFEKGRFFKLRQFEHHVFFICQGSFRKHLLLSGCVKASHSVKQENELAQLFWIAS